MANIDVMYSSKTDQWATPDDFFRELDQEFHFNLDPCANEQNHKCEKYFTKEDNGLSKDWGGYRVFCNPPYGRAITDWVDIQRSERDQAAAGGKGGSRTD